MAPQGPKVGSLKRRLRSQLARWEMKNCTPLWREGKLRCRKSARRCGAKHISKSKCAKHTSFGPLSEVEMSKKCTSLCREANFEVKMHEANQVRTTFGSCDVARSTFRSQNVKNTMGSDHVWTFRCALAWQAQGIVDLVKMSKTWGCCRISKNDGRRGTFEEDLQRCIFRGRRNTRDMFIRDVRRSGRWFPERGCILEHQIFRFAEMILRDKCSTSYDPVAFFRGRRSNLDRWSRKIGVWPCLFRPRKWLDYYPQIWQATLSWAHYTLYDLDTLPLFLELSPWRLFHPSCLTKLQEHLSTVCLSADWTGALVLVCFVSTTAQIFLTFGHLSSRLSGWPSVPWVYSFFIFRFRVVCWGPCQSACSVYRPALSVLVRRLLFGLCVFLLVSCGVASVSWPLEGVVCVSPLLFWAFFLCCLGLLRIGSFPPSSVPLVLPAPRLVPWGLLVQSLFCWSLPPGIWLYLATARFGMECCDG